MAIFALKNVSGEGKPELEVKNIELFILSKVEDREKHAEGDPWMVEMQTDKKVLDYPPDLPVPCTTYYFCLL